MYNSKSVDGANKVFVLFTIQGSVDQENATRFRDLLVAYLASHISKLTLHYSEENGLLPNTSWAKIVPIEVMKLINAALTVTNFQLAYRPLTAYEETPEGLIALLGDSELQPA